MSLSRNLLATALLAISILAPAQAWSQTCTFTSTSLNFGSVDTLSSSPTDMSVNIGYTCSSLLSLGIRICPNLGTGSGGSTSAAARQMTSGANALDYQLFSNSGRSTVWGAYFWPYPPRAPVISVGLAALGIPVSGTFTVYGRVFGSQGTVPPGAYTSSFSGAGQIQFRYYDALIFPGNCNAGGGINGSATFGVQATVPANCLIATQNIDFGTAGILGSNVDATGQVSVTCTPATAYTISLNNGITGTGPTARRMTLGAQAVTYGLFKDNARSQPWGDATTPGSTVPGTGSGVTQAYTVYGRVPPQTTPSPGTYTDTVVVTVTY